MNLGEFQRIQAVCVLVVWLFIGCDQKEQPVEPVAVSAESDPLRVTELKSKKVAMMENIATMQSDMITLRREISELQEKSSDVEAKLADVEAFKEKISKNLKELEKRLAGEFKGIPTHLDMPPLHEVAEAMNRRINELAEENAVLKKKLEERTK